MSNLLSFSPAPCSTCLVSFISTPDRGRVLIADRDVAAGELLLRESALLKSNWDEFRCLECDQPHSPPRCPIVKSLYTPSMSRGLHRLSLALSEIAGIDELDRARCLIKCLNEYRLHGLRGFLGPLLSLSAVTESSCMDSIVLASQLPLARQTSLFPAGLDLPSVARLLSILNTNSHQLSDIEGSGIFLRSALAEHSCFPNANFVSRGAELSVFAIQNISRGSSVSIDYGNFFLYQPTELRRAALKSSHQFHCDCSICSGQLADRCRQFKCPQTHCDGAIIARGNSFDPCGKCAHSIDADAAVSLCALESRLILLTEKFRRPVEESFDDSDAEDFIDFKSAAFSFDRPPAEYKVAEQSSDAAVSESVDPLTIGSEVFCELPEESPAEFASAFVTRLLSVSPLLRCHWLIFEIFDRAAREFSSLGSPAALGEAEKIFRTQLECMKLVIQMPFHEEFANLLDCLAQVLIGLGRIDEAKQLFAEAANIATVVSGADSHLTCQLQSLAHSTPRSAVELQTFYSNFQSAMAEAEFRAQENGLEIVGKSMEKATEQDQSEAKMQENNNKKGKKKKNLSLG